MTVSTFRQKLIEELVAETGDLRCHYCHIRVRRNFISGEHNRNAATVDHKIPRSKGGTNARENLVLACNGCNNLKGDRSYEDFVRNPNPKAPRVIVKKTKPYVHPAYKVTKGTLAHAVESGIAEPHGVYKKPKCEINPEPRNRITPVPYHETVWILTGKRVPKRADIFDHR